MKPRNRKAHAQGHATRRCKDQARYQASQWGFLKMKIGLDICSCLGRQETSALDSSDRCFLAGRRGHKEVPDSVRCKVEEGRKREGRLSFASQTPDFFCGWDRSWRAESKRLRSSKCLGLCFFICKMKALLLCGGCMKIIHSMSKASVIPSTLQLLPTY